jgi:SAM-dependent methyltransferase
MPTAEEARTYPRGDIELAFCRACGFIFNRVYDAGLQEYSSRYEETQSFSPTFNAFHRGLAARLIERYHLRGKTVLEIGCGKGEFLLLLCELGGNRGVGFDPSFRKDRYATLPEDRVVFIADFYSERYASYRADFVCCKMTLEHIPDTAAFLSMVRATVGARPDTLVFFQVPDVVRILREVAFWDIYYEHCSYFSLGSLARLFRRAGFDLVDLERDYADQYLMVTARPGAGSGPPLAGEDDLPSLARDVGRFAARCQGRIAGWRRFLREARRAGRRVVLWGGGSKAVAFLTTLGIEDEVQYVVDINPYKQGTFTPGTGHPIVGPETLPTSPPDVVVVMNPVYREEIERQLRQVRVFPRLLVV